MHYPRPVTTIKQIEITSRCNLACVYCPHPQMTRPKVDMADHTVRQSLELVRHFREQGTQGELSITGIGEALLHPRFVEILTSARQALGWSHPLVFSTNGILLTEEVAQAIAPLKPQVFVSLHRPEVAALAIEHCKKHKIAVGTNHSFVDSSLNWAGQVDWHVSAPKRPCEFLRTGWGVVLVNGQVTTCCLDSDFSGVIGNVWQPPEELLMRPYHLCDMCSDFPP